MGLALMIGGVCIVASMVSFNNCFHERRGAHAGGGWLLGNLVIVRMPIELLIALYALFRHWKDDDSGRLTFLIGVGLLAAGVCVGLWLRIWSEG